jgi:hypothetical protein
MARRRRPLRTTLVGRRPAVSARYLAGAVGLAAVAVGLLASEPTGQLTLLLGLLGLAVGLAAVHAYRNGGLAATVAVPVVVTLAPALYALLPLGPRLRELGPLAGAGPAVVLGLPLGVLAFLVGRAAD